MASNFQTYEITIANLGHGELSLTDTVSSEKEIKINPNTTNVRVLFTNRDSTDVADEHDYLLSNAETDFDTVSGLDRISFYNGSGGEVKVSVAVFS